MKISARNLFEGTISALQPSAVNAEVAIGLIGCATRKICAPHHNSPCRSSGTAKVSY